jgi:hypothetical protein
MELQIFDYPQNSPEWILARLGLVTTSEFKAVMAKGEGKTRRKYMLTVIGERLAKQPFERYMNSDMDRGHALEDEARDLYSMITDNEVKRVGFMRRGDVGYSPDGLIGNNGLQEIKTKLYHLHIECLLSNEVPTEHRQQCQGGLWVSGREWIDFVSYSPGLELFVKRVHRDEPYIARIKIEVEAFLAEMYQLIEQVNKYKRAA